MAIMNYLALILLHMHQSSTVPHHCTHHAPSLCGTLPLYQTCTKPLQYLTTVPTMHQSSAVIYHYTNHTTSLHGISPLYHGTSPLFQPCTSLHSTSPLYQPCTNPLLYLTTVPTMHQASAVPHHCTNHAPSLCSTSPLYQPCINPLQYLTTIPSMR